MAHLSTYISVCRDLLRPNSPLDGASDETWEESLRKLKKLRQLLLCRTCKEICPVLFNSGNCQHLICQDCKAKRGTNFTGLGCRYCKRSETLVVDKQIESVLSCYAKLCELLYNYGITENDTVRGKRLCKIWNIIMEGVQVASYFEQKSEKTVADDVFERPSGSNSKVSDGHANDASRHICIESNITKDGRLSKDGDTVQDGGTAQDGGDVKDTGSCEGVGIEKNEETGDEEPCSVWSEERGKVVNNAEDKGKAEEPNLTPIVVDEEKKPKDTRKVEIRGVKESTEETLMEENFKSENKMDLMKNGILKQSFLLEKDVNCTPQELGNKRKLRLSTCNEDRKHLYSFKIKKRKSKNDYSEEMQPFNEEACQSTLRDDGCTTDKNSKYESDEDTGTRSNGFTKKSSDQKSTQRSHENSDSPMKAKLYRKNKYKCSCGTTGIKCYSDVCNHRRCACFAAEVPCTNCKCRFCSNPYKTVSEQIWPSLSKNSTNGVGVDDDVDVDIVS
eukprot:gene11216-12393_t